MNREVEIFISYTHQDKELAKEFLKHLRVLEDRIPSVSIWSTDYLIPGQAWNKTIREHLEGAQIILPLLSPAFLSSKKELLLIEEKAQARTVLVIPILLRPIDRSQTFFAHIQGLPMNGRALTMWKSRDLAYLEIVDKLEEAVENLRNPRTQKEV